MSYFEVGDFDNQRDEMRYDEVDGHVENVEFGDDDNEGLYFAFGNQQSMFSQSVEMIELFLEAGAQLSGLKSEDPAAMLVLQADRAMLQGGANTTIQLGHDNWDSSILSNIDTIALVLADENGAASVRAEVQAKSPEIAESVRNIVEGLVALKALDAADEPALSELLRAAHIETNGATILLDMYLDEALIEKLKDL
jgi:hypothetical protein